MTNVIKFLSGAVLGILILLIAGFSESQPRKVETKILQYKEFDSFRSDAYSHIRQGYVIDKLSESHNGEWNRDHIIVVYIKK